MRFVRDFVGLDRPVLLRGLVGKELLEEWSRDRLTKRIGTETFQVIAYPRGDVGCVPVDPIRLAARIP